MRGGRNSDPLHYVAQAGSAVIRCIVRFDGEIPADIESKCLFDFEVALRKRSGLDIWVLKERMADDSKLRVITDMRRSKK